MNKRILLLASLVLGMAIAGCSTTPEKTNEATPVAKSAATGKYPVHDRLEYMFQCIRSHGGKEEATQPCGCKIDEIAKKMTFADFELAKTFSQLSKQAGDAGNAFRNPDQSKNLKKRLKEADDAAEKTCFK